MNNRDFLSILLKSTIAAGLLVQSAFADVNGHLLVESSGIKAVDRQLDVSLTENGEVRIAWDADLLGQARLQVSDNYADWAEVPNASNPFFTPINNEVNTYYRVVYDLSGDTRNTLPEDFGIKRIYGDTDGDGINDRGVFGTDDEPGPDLLWVDKDGDGLVDEDELTPIAAGHDALKVVISNLKTVDGGSVPIPLEWLDDILDGFEEAAGNDQRWVIADAVRIERIGGEGDNAGEKDWIQIVKLQYEGGLAEKSVPLPLEWLKDVIDDLAGSAGSDEGQRWVIADAVRIERIGDPGTGGDNVTSKEWISILKDQYEGALAGDSVPVPIEWLKGVLDDLAMSSGVNAEAGWVIADALRIERIGDPDVAGDVRPGSGAVYIFHRGDDNGNRSQSLHDTAMAVIRKINAAPDGSNGSGGSGNAIIVIRTAGNDPLLQMITIVPEKVERAGVDEDPPPGSIEWLDEFLKDIFGSAGGSNGTGEHDTALAVIRKFYGTGEDGAIAEMIVLVNNHYAGAAGGETPLSPMFESLESVVVLAITGNDPDLNDSINSLLNKLWHDAIPEEDELGIGFPDWLGPPGIWTTGGSSGLMAADLGFGYDTFGIRLAICVNQATADNVWNCAHDSLSISRDENGTTVTLDLQDIDDDGRIRVSELATMCARWSANSDWLVICPFDDNNSSLSAGGQVDDLWKWRENIERGLSVIWTAGGTTGIWTSGTITSFVDNDGGQEGAPLQAGDAQPAWLVLGIAASDSPIEGVMEFIVEILEVMKTKHDTAKAAINNVR